MLYGTVVDSEVGSGGTDVGVRTPTWVDWVVGDGGTLVLVAGALVAVGGTLVAVGGALVDVGGTPVGDGGTLVAVGGILVAVGGMRVAVGGMRVAVGGIRVAVGGIRVGGMRVGRRVAVGGTGDGGTWVGAGPAVGGDVGLAGAVALLVAVGLGNPVAVAVTRAGVDDAWPAGWVAVWVDRMAACVGVGETVAVAGGNAVPASPSTLQMTPKPMR